MKKLQFIAICVFVCLMCICAFGAENDVYFLRDGGSGNGASASTAGGSLVDAYNALSDGGTIVVCGVYTVSEVHNSISHSGKITVTSVYGGTDYRKSGACINFANNMYCGGETEFCNIVLNSATLYPAIYAYNYPLVLGEGIECGKANGSEQYVSVMGGGNGVYKNKTTNLTIISGTWQRVRGGSGAGGSTNYTVNITVNGGEFVEKVTLGSNGTHGGDIYATINGGTFYQGVVVASLEGEKTVTNSDGSTTVTPAQTLNSIV